MKRVVLFVYGTLMRGEPAHALLGPSARFIAAGWTEPRFTLFHLGAYPALVDGGQTAVAGELYEIDAALLPALDEYEDVPEMYDRTEIDVGGQRALTYLLHAPLAAGRPTIASGDWRQH